MAHDPALHDDPSRRDVHLVRAPPPHARRDDDETWTDEEHDEQRVVRPSDSEVVRRELDGHYRPNRHPRRAQHATSDRRHRDDVMLAVTQCQSPSHASRVRTRAARG